MLGSNGFAFIAGTCGSGASFFGKLSGNFGFKESFIMSTFCLAAMIILNGVMWTFFSKALNSSTTSVGPTVASAATNYLLSGLLGVLVFGESTSLLWWAGTSCVLLGLLLISRGAKENL